MVYTITPNYIPKPAGMLCWDGANFWAVKGDASGRVAVNALSVTPDQLPSYKSSLYSESYGAISGANGYRNSAAVPAGEVWHVTAITAYETNRTTSEQNYSIIIDDHNYWLYQVVGTLGAYVHTQWYGELWLEAGAFVRAYFIGSAAGDTVGLWLHGQRMTKAV